MTLNAHSNWNLRIRTALLAEIEARDVRIRTLEHAIADIGKREGPEVAHLGGGIMDYWQWPASSRITPPRMPDWCVAAAGQWIRQGLSLPDWDRSGKSFAPSLPGFPLGVTINGRYRSGVWLVGGRQLHAWADLDPTRRYLASPVPGALFTINDAAHTGLVAFVDRQGFHTVEGNLDNKVNVRVRVVNANTRFIRWW
jgi:hypothetical protein